MADEYWQDLFRRQGPVMKLELLYDRAGRSEGIAFVTYEVEADATAAIHAYNGANANGQPIKLTLVTRNTAASAGNPGRASQSQPRSLFDRIGNTNKNPHERRHSADDRRDPTRKATPPGIDRYVPPERRRERDRERAQSGPRPVGGRDATRGRRGGGGGGTGAGRENGRDGGGVGRSGNGGSFRQRKTVEELDAEMNDYFGCAEQPIDGCINMAESTTGVAATAVAPLVDEDDDMIL
jgi:THO complex subunit 4